MPIDAITGLGALDWPSGAVPSTGAVAEPGAETGTGATSGEGGGFGTMLGDALSSLTALQQDAAVGAQQLAAGTAQDPTAVVMAVERAQLSMQLASQVRTKVVEAAQDLFHTQV
jgi:flagellar hook-basal body complex protein FliE